MGVIQKVGAILVKNAPKICVAIGVAGVGVGVAVACKDTLAGVDEINQAKVDICEKDYIPAIKRFAKVYWPSFVIIGGSLFVIVSGHYILAKRYAGLVVAYESLNKSYKSYRGYIKENYGNETDFNARHSKDRISMVETNEVFTEDEDIFIPDRDLSDFAVFFGRDYSELVSSDDPEEAYNHVKAQEEWANAVLQERGYIFLQEIYDALGIDRFAPDGVGWCAGIGDDFVDFGIYNVRNGRAVNGLEPVFLLDFNHDGYILPYI